MILVLLTVFIFVSPGSSTDLQKGPDVRKQFVIQLPGHWRLETFQIEESVDYGNADESIFKQRFTSEIVLKEDTYALDKKDETVTLLVPVAQAGEKRIVRGLATSVKKDGAWRTQIGLESDPTSGMGQTLNSFSGQVIVRGTPKEKQFLELRARKSQEQAAMAEEMAAKKREADEARAQKIELKRRQRENELKKQERQEELAEYEYQQKINETRQKFFEQQARNLFTMDLPGYWQLKTFSSGEPVLLDAGDEPGEQKIAQKFSAVIELTSDTFVAGEKLGEITLLNPIAKSGEQRRIYGKISVSPGTQNDSIVLDYDNKATTNLGETKDFFQGRVLIKGTPEAVKYHQQLHADELTKQQRKEELEEAKYKVEAARIAFEAKRKELKERQLARERMAAAKKEREEKQRIEREQKEKELQLAMEQEAAAKKEVEEKQRQEREQASRNKKREQELAEMKNALFGNDEMVRRRALETAIQSGDPQKQNLALASILNTNKSISGQLRSRGAKKELPFRIIIKEFNLGTNQFVGDVSAGGKTGAVNGNLQGTTISIDAQSLKGGNRPARLSFSAQLQKDGTMTGVASSKWLDIQAKQVSFRFF